MKLYKLSVGDVERLAVAKDEEEMFERRAEVEPSFDYLPVQIEEVTVEGYEIVAKPIGEEKPPNKRKTAK